MDFITEKFKSRLSISESGSADKKAWLQARIEYVFYFLLGYFWNRQQNDLVIDDLKNIVSDLEGALTIGKMIHYLEKFNEKEVIFSDSGKASLERYLKHRNEYIGHGYTFGDKIKDSENLLNSIYEDIKSSISILNEETDIIVVNKKTDDKYEGLIFKYKAPNVLKWSCSAELIKIKDNFENAVFARINNEYNQISPFVLVEGFEGNALVFNKLEEKLTGKTVYSNIFKTGKETRTIESFVSTGISSNYRRISSNNTIMNNFVTNYRDYFDVSLSEKVHDFIHNDRSDIIVTLWGDGGVGKTACVQKVCMDLYNDSKYRRKGKKQPFEYVVFVTAKNRYYNVKTGKIDERSQEQTYYNVISAIYSTINDKELMFTEGSPEFKNIEKEIRCINKNKDSERALLLVIDDFETFSDTEKEKINKFIHTLDINKHKVIVTTRNRQLLEGSLIQVSNMTLETTIEFLKQEISRNYEDFKEEFEELVKDETIQKRIYAATGNGIPIFILQWQHLYVQNINDEDLYQELPENETAKEFLTGKVYDSLTEKAKILYSAISQIVNEYNIFPKLTLNEICKKYITTDDSFDAVVNELEELHIIEQYQDNEFNKSNSVYRVYNKSFVDDMKKRFDSLDGSIKNSIKELKKVIGNNSDNVYESLLIEAKQNKINGTETDVVSKYRHIIKLKDCPTNIRMKALNDLILYYFQTKDNSNDAKNLFQEFEPEATASSEVMYSFIYSLWGTTSKEDKKYAFKVIKEYLKGSNEVNADNVRFYALGLGYFVKYINNSASDPENIELVCCFGDMLYSFISGNLEGNNLAAANKYKHEIKTALVQIIKFYDVNSKKNSQLSDKCNEIGTFFLKKFPDSVPDCKAVKNIIDKIKYFIFDSVFYDRYEYGKINGVFGHVDSPENKALLHISNVSSNTVSQEQMQTFIKYLRYHKRIRVNLVNKTDKGMNVSLIGISPSFDDMIASFNKTVISNPEYIGKDMSEEINSMLEQQYVMNNVEITSRNILRGKIEGTEYGVSISKNNLIENNINPQEYAGRKIMVKLTRWDENAQKFNAEWISAVD